MKLFIKEKINNKLHNSEIKGLLCGIALIPVLWLVMYPEFSITADCCRVVDENGEEIVVDWSDRELAEAVLEADGDQIVVKSRIWEFITQGSEENDNGRSEN